MELSEVEFDVEKVQELLKKIKTTELKSILDNYSSNIEQIVGSIAVPLALMSHGLKSVKYFQFWLEGSIATKNVGKEKTEKGKKEIEEFIGAKFKDYDSIKDAKIEIKKIKNAIPFIANSIQNDSFNTLVNCWTYFEATIKDLWISSLNNYPKIFLSNILKSNSQLNEIEGISGKNISIGLLAKYNFNISNCLGDILVTKYDFTSTNGIYRSYKDLLGFNSIELDFFRTKKLVQLEITRHLLVHSAGKIDQDYLRKTCKNDEILNEKIQILPQKFGDYCNESINAIIKIFEVVDEYIYNR